MKRNNKNFYDKYLYHARLAKFYLTLHYIEKGYNVNEALRKTQFSGHTFHRLIRRGNRLREYNEALRRGARKLVEEGLAFEIEV